VDKIAIQRQLPGRADEKEVVDIGRHYFGERQQSPQQDDRQAESPEEISAIGWTL
jgi:hypothetical protein